MKGHCPPSRILLAAENVLRTRPKRTVASIEAAYFRDPIGESFQRLPELIGASGGGMTSPVSRATAHAAARSATTCLCLAIGFKSAATSTAPIRPRVIAEACLTGADSGVRDTTSRTRALSA